jgi:azurin
LIHHFEERSMKVKTYALASVLLLGATVSVQAADKVCKLEITGNDMMQYDKKELAAAADCTQIEVTLKHVGKLAAPVMGHNWVLTKTADAAAVASAGLTAGIKNNHVPAGDKRVLAHTKVVGGGESDTVKFPASVLKKGESYTFECTFPGHSSIMKGTFKFG